MICIWVLMLTYIWRYGLLNALRRINVSLRLIESDLIFAVLFIDMKEGEVGDMEKLGITESFQVKRQVLISASEAAEMILRVDDIIKAAPRPRQPDHRHH